MLRGVRAVARGIPALRGRSGWRRLASTNRSGGGGSSGGWSQFEGEPGRIIWYPIPFLIVLVYGGRALFDDFAALRVPFPTADVAADISDVVRRRGCGPLFIRLCWQTCCLYDAADGSGRPVGQVMTPPYSNLPCCRGLDRAVDLLRPIYERYEGKISWPDLIVLAGCVSVEEMGGPRVTFRWGRSEDPKQRIIPSTDPDGEDNLAEMAKRCPDQSKGLKHVNRLFHRMGFTPRETVALMGCHTVGGMHKRFCGLDGEWTTTTRVFDSAYFTEMLDGKWVLSQEPGKPMHYRNSATELVMLPADIALLSDERYLKHVKEFSELELEFYSTFVTAFQKLTELGWEKELSATSHRSHTLVPF